MLKNLTLLTVLLPAFQFVFSKDNQTLAKPVRNKVVDGYRYELTPDPEDVIVEESKGTYAKRIRVYKVPEQTFFFEYVAYGDALTETPAERDSFEILHVNFDGIPDIRFSHTGGYHTYLVSCKSHMGTGFYSEIWLNRIRDFTRDTALKVLTGSFTMYHKEYIHTFRGTYLDTLVMFSQTLYPPIYAEEYYYLDNLGAISLIHDMGRKPPPLVQKREEGDYNFDGHPDLRVRDTSGVRLWQYYLYDTVATTLVYDTLLSNMWETSFEGGKEKFYGTLATWPDEVLQIIETYRYVNGKLTLFARRECRQKSPNSERTDCVLYELRNGKMEFVEFLPGAE